jgi:hypothetical protein
MKAQGFRILPLSANKSNKYAALALWGTLGYFLGGALVASKIGDKTSADYLVRNKAEIL